MAGCEERTKLVEVTPMDVREASKKRTREFVKSWFVEQALAADGQETSIDFAKRLSSEFMMPLKGKVDKARLVAVEPLDGEGKRFSGSAAASETATEKIQPEKMDKAKRAAVKASGGEEKMDKIQMEKIDKTVVEVLDGEKNRFSTIASGAPVETAVDNVDEYAESDYDDAEDLSYIINLAERLNRSEDWIEEQRQHYRVRAAVSKKVRDQLFDWIRNGCPEEEEEDELDDEEYEANYARLVKINDELWAENCDFSGLVRQDGSVIA